MAIIKATDVRIQYNSIDIASEAPDAHLAMQPIEYSIDISFHADKSGYLVRRILRRLAYLTVQRNIRWN